MRSRANAFTDDNQKSLQDIVPIHLSDDIRVEWFQYQERLDEQIRIERRI